MTPRTLWPESVRALSVGARGDPYPPSAHTVPAKPHLPRVHRYETSVHAADMVLATDSGLDGRCFDHSECLSCGANRSCRLSEYSPALIRGQQLPTPPRVALNSTRGYLISESLSNGKRDSQRGSRCRAMEARSGLANKLFRSLGLIQPPLGSRPAAKEECNEGFSDAARFRRSGRWGRSLAGGASGAAHGCRRGGCMAQTAAGDNL